MSLPTWLITIGAYMKKGCYSYNVGPTDKHEVAIGAESNSSILVVMPLAQIQPAAAAVKQSATVATQCEQERSFTGSQTTDPRVVATDGYVTNRQSFSTLDASELIATLITASTLLDEYQIATRVAALPSSPREHYSEDTPKFCLMRLASTRRVVLRSTEF